jgi:phage gp29-like protein
MSIPINIIYPQLDQLTAKDRDNLKACAFELQVKLTDDKTQFTETDAYELLSKIGMKMARKGR